MQGVVERLVSTACGHRASVEAGIMKSRDRWHSSYIDGNDRGTWHSTARIQDFVYVPRAQVNKSRFALG